MFPLPPPAFFEWPWLLPLAKEPFLSVDIIPITVQWTVQLMCLQGTPTPLVRLSLQAALLSHCTSITAASMRLPYPPGSPATRLAAQLSPAVLRSPCLCCGDIVSLSFMCVSYSVCICPNILHETTCSGFVITALCTPEN